MRKAESGDEVDDTAAAIKCDDRRGGEFKEVPRDRESARDGSQRIRNSRKRSAEEAVARQEPVGEDVMVEGEGVEAIEERA